MASLIVLGSEEGQRKAFFSPKKVPLLSCPLSLQKLNRKKKKKNTTCLHHQNKNRVGFPWESGGVRLSQNQCPELCNKQGSQLSEHQCIMSGGISMQINAEYEGLKKGEINLFHNTGHFFSLPCTLFFKSCTQLLEGIQLPSVVVLLYKKQNIHI